MDATVCWIAGKNCLNTSGKMMTMICAWLAWTLPVTHHCRLCAVIYPEFGVLQDARDLANKIRKFGFCFMEHLTQFSREVNPPTNVIFNPLIVSCEIQNLSLHCLYSNQTPLYCIALLM